MFIPFEETGIAMSDVTFSVNEYDHDGDCIIQGLYLNVGNCVKIPFKNPDHLEQFGKKVLNMLEEIKENWQ